MAIDRESLTTEQNKLLNDIERYEEIVETADKMVEQYLDKWFDLIEELPQNWVSLDQVVIEAFEEYERRTGEEDVFEKYNDHPAVDDAVTSELVEYEKEMNVHGFILQTDNQSFAVAMDIQWSAEDVLVIAEYFGDYFPTVTLPARNQLSTLAETAKEIAGYYEEDLDYYLEEDMDTLRDYHRELEDIVSSYQDDISNLDKEVRDGYEMGINWVNEMEYRLPIRIAERLKTRLP